MHFLEVVRNNIERLNILVSDLLDISRIESGRVQLEQGHVNLYDIAEEVVAEVLPEDKLKKIKEINPIFQWQANLMMYCAPFFLIIWLLSPFIILGMLYSL